MRLTNKRCHHYIIHIQGEGINFYRTRCFIRDVTFSRTWNHCRRAVVHFCFGDGSSLSVVRSIRKCWQGNAWYSKGCQGNRLCCRCCRTFTEPKEVHQPWCCSIVFKCHYLRELFQSFIDQIHISVDILNLCFYVKGNIFNQFRISLKLILISSKFSLMLIFLNILEHFTNIEMTN